jgi:UPF0271 protein
MRVDLNCDMGESFGVYTLGNDAAIMPHISSANIACGFHAGDPHVMYRTIELARKHGVSVGAHPSYPDLAGFGRRALGLTPQEVYEVAVYQIGAFQAMARALGAEVTHVKAHGAIYNVAAKDRLIALALAKATKAVDSNLAFVGLAGSVMIEAAEEVGLRAVNEVFADRGYLADGSLVPRSHPRALHHNVDEAVAQVMQMVTEGTVTAITGERVALRAQSICLHGDGAHAVEFAVAIRKALDDAQVVVRGLRGWE